MPCYKKKKKSTKKEWNDDHYYLHIHSTTLQHIYMNTLETIYTVGFTLPCCTVFKQKYMTNLVYLRTLSSDWNAKGLNFDCNSKTELTLQFTRQLRVYVEYVCDVGMSNRKESPNTGLYIQSSLVNKTRLWAKTGNWHSRRITDFTQITPQREMLSPSSVLAVRIGSCLCKPEELRILPDCHPCQQTTYVWTSC